MITNKKRLIKTGLITALLLCVAGCGKELPEQELILQEDPVAAGNTEQVTITLSKPAGFYDEPFDLTIEAGGRTIYYTLDGSMPTPESSVYESALQITDASANENLYASRDDTSIFFVTGDYHVQTQPVDKCTVLRAAVYDDAGQLSGQVTASYFVGFQDKTGYAGMNFVSLVTDPDNLFDYDTGIYVLGKCFDDAVSAGEDYSTPESRYHYPANYQNKGREWEREVYGEFFANDGTPLGAQAFGLRIKGVGVRDRLPKSFNFYARKEYSGDKYFEADLLDLGYSLRRMSLYACGEDRSKSKGVMVSEIVDELGLQISTLTYVPYVLFLDGEYWGVYWLTDRFDGVYVEENYGVDKDDVVMVKRGAIEVGEEEDLELYEDLLSFFENNDMSDAANYEEAKRLVDMQSLIDYYAVEIYIANVDWPFNNYELWRSRSSDGEGYADGRWRWMLYDLDGLGVMDQWTAEQVSFDDVRGHDVLFDSLSNNAEFREDFCAKLRELGDGRFSSEQMNTTIDRYVNMMFLPVEKESERFVRTEEEEAAWVQGEYMKGFFERRRPFIEEQIEEYLSQD